MTLWIGLGHTMLATLLQLWKEIRLAFGTFFTLLLVGAIEEFRDFKATLIIDIKFRKFNILRQN